MKKLIVVAFALASVVAFAQEGQNTGTANTATGGTTEQQTTTTTKKMKKHHGKKKKAKKSEAEQGAGNGQ